MKMTVSSGVGLGLSIWLITSLTGCWWDQAKKPDAQAEAKKPKFDLDPPVKWKVGPDSSDEDDPPGPLADARERVKKFEKKRAALQPLLDKALAERDELVDKLRAAGVNTPADLNGNLRGQRLAESVTKIGTEIDGLERQIAATDAAIREAKAVVRRLERERAGISDEEMERLAKQLRDAEDRTDKAGTLPVTPLDVEAALEKAMKGSRLRPSPSVAGSSSKRLVGKWEIVEGEQKGTATFTEGGTVLFVWWHTGLRKNWTDTGNYTVVGRKLKIKASGEYGSESTREFEFLTDDELLIQKPTCCDFTWLYGRLKRVK